MPAQITDYRDPTKGQGEYRSYTGKDGKRVRFWDKTPRTNVVLTTDGGLIVFYYGDRNTIPYGELLNVTRSRMDKTLQTDDFDIIVKGTGYLIDRARGDPGSWEGDRNRYSTDVVEVVRALYERGAATLSMPIWLGSWSAGQGEHIGTVRAILAVAEMPRQITLFHGTDTLRLRQIEKTGLRPMAFDDRVWNNSSLDKVRPEHRENAIYLTASRPQAEYYAQRAVNTDRKRFGPSKSSEIRRMGHDASLRVHQMTAALAGFERMTPEQIAATDEHARKYDYRAETIDSKRRYYPQAIERLQAIVDKAEQFLARDFYGKFEQVILQVTLYKSEFANLLADDDYLRQHVDATPQDWRQSLSIFGQVAYRGIIPPERIKVLAHGNDIGRKLR